MPPTRKVETTEHVVVEALICIEEIWDEVLEETHRKYKWITLEPIKDEKVIESYVVDNIDEFARKKAREYKRKPRTRAGGQGGARGRANPSQELKALMAISQSA